MIPLKIIGHEAQRLFHGRGKKTPHFEHLSIDYFNPSVLVTTYKELTSEEKIQLVNFISLEPQIVSNNIILQKRYLKFDTIEVLKGEIPTDAWAVENEEKYVINLSASQNIGFFLDMKEGRSYLRENSKNKKVLNLFSYTCALSVAAIKGGASEVINVDMSKSALKTGSLNHQINNIPNVKVKYLSHDIMKSFGNLTKKGPYDLIILDPPSNQGESFKIERDYPKLVRRMSEALSAKGEIMACLNSPHYTTKYLIDLFKAEASDLHPTHLMYSAFKESEMNIEEALKIVIFKKP